MKTSDSGTGQRPAAGPDAGEGIGAARWQTSSTAALRVRREGGLIDRGHHRSFVVALGVLVAVAGIIFDRQAEAAEIIAEQQARLDAVEHAVEGESKPKVIYWDAYDFENIRLLPFGNFQDAVARAGGEILFADVTDDKPVSREQIATAAVDVVLAIDYGADTTAPLLPDMRELVKNTPAGKRGEQSVVAVTNFPPNLQSVSLVEAIAKVLHPDKFS